MKFTVEKKNENMSLGDFLKKEKNLSRRLINKLKTTDGITVNGVPSWTNKILFENDSVEIVFPKNSSENIIPHKDREVEIIFEDENLLVLNKPFDMPPHPSKGHTVGTLGNFILWYYNQNNIKTSVRILGRLDKDTSGLTILCKNQYIQNVLSKAKVKKEYIAVVEGIFKEKRGIIDLPIERSSDGIKREVRYDGKKALTEYEVLEEKNGFSMVRVNLLTGRTHQIRVHFSHIGHPLAGDSLYGGNMIFHRQALHCHKLIFPELDISFEAPLFYDIKEFWDNI